MAAALVSVIIWAQFNYSIPESNFLFYFQIQSWAHQSHCQIPFWWWKDFINFLLSLSPKVNYFGKSEGKLLGTHKLSQAANTDSAPLVAVITLFFSFLGKTCFFSPDLPHSLIFSVSIWAIPSVLAEALGVLIHGRITWFWHSLHSLPAYLWIILSLQRCAVDTCSFRLPLCLPHPSPLPACVITAHASYLEGDALSSSHTAPPIYPHKILIITAEVLAVLLSWCFWNMQSPPRCPAGTVPCCVVTKVKHHPLLSLSSCSWVPAGPEATET